MAFNIPFIERTVWQYALRDKCLIPIMIYESKRNVSVSHAKVHPKDTLPEAREVMKCFVNQ